MNLVKKSLFCFLIFVNLFDVHGRLEEFLKWKQISYANLPPIYDDNYNTGRNETTYVPYNNVLFGANHYKGLLFLTIPRRQLGIPATLSVIDLNNLSPDDQSPKLIGYPSYETNELMPDFQPNPDRIISVYRTKTDVCGRLWFVDTGFLELPRNPIQVQNPALWIIDLQTHQRIRRVELENNVFRTRAGHSGVTVDVEADNCYDAYAYIPDTSLYQLHVYSFRLNKVWTVRHNYFSFDPLAGDLNIANLKFQWRDGIFSMSLGPKLPNGYRAAFFLPMVSTSLFAVSTQVLRNETLASRFYHEKDFKVLGFRGFERQAAMHDIDLKTGVIFYGELQQNSMGCWNTAKRYTPKNHGIVDRDDNKMVYQTDLNVDADSVVWMLTNSFPIYVYSRYNENNYNYRLWRGRASDLIKGTVCDVFPKTSPHCHEEFSQYG